MCNVYMFIIPTSSPRPGHAAPASSASLSSSVTALAQCSEQLLDTAILIHFYNFSPSAWSTCRPVASSTGEFRIYLHNFFSFYGLWGSRSGRKEDLRNVRRGLTRHLSLQSPLSGIRILSFIVTLLRARVLSPDSLSLLRPGLHVCVFTEYFSGLLCSLSRSPVWYWQQNADGDV